MKNPPTLYQARGLGKYKNILPKSAPKTQGYRTKFLYSSHNLPKITQLIDKDCCTSVQVKGGQA
jgi:hypothetical protein